ncbi:carbohydrate porin [Acidisoma cellulosilytica]|uniref:Carbohydrate porin n=1 Tax=Acidisoma cellulosilyticum TaxID=2802395 RepID=A0A964E661_9PROT|nr:carbohydrate porin [Acidisoma cellulosilyticum]MCB8882678.1 carbohydrate porin [Acidisoma cellulosilyticum]
MVKRTGWLAGGLLSTLTGLALLPACAFAQSAQAPQSTPADSFANPEHLFGDWGGVRTDLGRLGINLLLDYTSESAGNVAGGTRRALDYADQRALELDIDWQKLAGIQGFSTHMVIVNRAGNNTSAAFGDNLMPVQEIYGAGGNVAFHLVYIYGEEALLNGRLDIAGGYFPVGNDFAASPLNCNFMNNGLCGNPKELSGGNDGFSAWPDATLGGRLRVKPTTDTYIQAGAFGVDPYLYSVPQDRTGWQIDASQYNGVEVPVEAAWEPSFGPDHLIGHYKLGFGYNSAPYAAFESDTPGTAGPEKRNRWQFWALADQMLIRQGEGDQAGLIGLAGYMHSNPDTLIYQDEAFAGLVDQGFWKVRPQDSIGLLFIYQKVSGQLTSAERLDQAFGLPYTNSDTGVTATGVQTNEEILEANYDIHVYRGVNLMPDFQYVIHPNAQTDIPNAVVLGLKAHVEF